VKFCINIATSLLDFENRFHHELYALTKQQNIGLRAQLFESRLAIDGYALQSLVQDKAGPRETQSGASICFILGSVLHAGV
jgi:hypothetical protein